MSEFTPSDELVAEVVLRRYGDGAAPAARAVTRVLARATREDHVALDLAGPLEGAAPPREVLAALHAAARLTQFTGVQDVLAPEGPPLVVVDDRYLYLRRLAGAEQRVASALVSSRAERVPAPGGLDQGTIDRAVEALGDDLARTGTPSPELAEVVERCLTRSVSFVTGGPGTGKTWIVAQVLRVLDRALVAAGVDEPVHVVVAAPTGKAARRVAATLDLHLGEGFERVVRDREREGSIHRLLGLFPGRTDPPKALHHDVIVVDEVSMADLALLDALIGACSRDPARPTHLVLVGDPHQLASVNVGAVLADVTDPAAGLADLVSRLRTVRRTEQEALLELAQAVNDGDVEGVARRLDAGGAVTHRPDVADPATGARVVEHARRVAERALVGDAAGALEEMGRLVVLAGNREGPGSVAWWNAFVGSRHRAHFPVASGERFSVGEPILVTRNQRAIGVSNGDLGVVLERGGRRVAVFDAGRELALSGVGYLEGAWAMTIHKSQGSEFDHVVVSLPRVESAIMTRELLYTAITRAGESVTVLGERAAIARAVATPVTRVSGLTHRLAHWPDAPSA